MKNIVVSMQNTLLSEAIAHALTETREFRVEQMVPSSIMRKFIYNSSRTQSAQGRETCP